jgi:type VI secretion system protein ImpB
MSKEASVAPKERVNIRYKPVTGDVKEDVELPLKMLVMGEFSTKKDDTPIAERKLLDINKDNFNQVMQSQDLALEVAVPNRLDDSAADDPDNKLAVHLKFDTLKDFEPDAVARQVPELSKLVDLREALLALKGPLGNIPSFRKALQHVLDDEAARQQLLQELGIDVSASGPPTDSPKK